MRIICVDDEPLAVEDVLSVCRDLSSDVLVNGFTDVNEALEWIRSNPVDAALLDIDMPQMNGITLAAQIKKIKPDMIILFLTAYKEFAFDAFQVHPNGYLLKPLLPEILQKELDYAASVHPQTAVPHIEARTFGNFDLLVDGELVTFKRARSKELLAYLIDRRGISASRKEMAAVLFEDESYDHNHQKYLDVIIRSLRDTLKEYGIEEIFYMERRGLRIIPEKISCDMYRFYQGDTEAIRLFRGEYLVSYAWASFMEEDMRFKSGNNAY